MITVLRKIRKSLVEASSMKKYGLYAFGEIALVVIGILIALQINTWNENKKAREREIRLLNELIENLNVNEQRLTRDIELELKYFNSSKIIVDHLDKKLPYHDSLDIHFQLSQLSADIVLVTSAYEAIKSIGFDVISNDSLRTHIINLFDTNYESMIRETRSLEDQFWPSVVIPMWVKHLRNNSMDEDLSGQRPINYNALLNDPEFTSMIEKRGIFRRLAAELKRESLLETRALKAEIEKEIRSEE